MKKSNVAIIGAGNWGQIHAMTYASTQAANLVCICDLDEARAKALAEKYQCNYTTDSCEIANDSEIEIVSVTTPDFAHFTPVMQVLEAGKNVIVEKPLATNLKEAEEMTAKAKEKAVKFMTDFHLRWNLPFLSAKNLISSGKIGKPVMGYSRQSNTISIVNNLSWAKKSGPHWFLYPHSVDLVRWLVGQEAKSVYAVARKEILAGMGFDTYDAIQALVTFEDCFVTFETAWILPNSFPKEVDMRLEVVGTSGKLESRQDNQGLELAAEQFRTPGILGLQTAYGQMYGFFKEPILHFLDCVQNDRPCAVDIDDGLAVTRIIDAISRSLETGSMIEIAA